MERTIAEELRKKYGIDLGERIGRGAFGEVYRARSSGGDCAIKISLDPIDSSELWVAQELKGLELVKRVKGHPHIVTLFDVWRVQGYLVTRWELGQQSLADRLKECQRQGLPGIPRDELLRYMKQAAVAIDFLNQKGIYHRDIKPENLVLFHGYVKLADLGLAKFVGASTGSHSGSGTLGYVPPEAHEDRLTSSSDLYALAATYIKLRTGHEPFGRNPIEITKRQEAGKPILDGLDDGEKEVVRSALAYRPEDRPQAAHTWVKLLTKPSEPQSKVGSQPRKVAELDPIDIKIVRRALAQQSGGRPDSDRVNSPQPALASRSNTSSPSSPLRTQDHEHYRHSCLVREMKRLLQLHETAARLRFLSLPLTQACYLGVIVGFLGGLGLGAFIIKFDIFAPKHVDSSINPSYHYRFDGKIYRLVENGYGDGLAKNLTVEEYMHLMKKNEAGEDYWREEKKWELYSCIISVIVGLTLCCTVVWLRLRLRREAAAKAEQKIPSQIQALLAEFPRESQVWGGHSVLNDPELLRDIVRELETTS